MTRTLISSAACVTWVLIGFAQSSWAATPRDPLLECREFFAQSTHDAWRIKFNGEATPAAQNFVKTLAEPTVLKGPPESAAIARESVVLEGRGFAHAEAGANPGELLIKPSKTSPISYDGTSYIEFPNSTMLQTLDPLTGKPRSFLMVRGVRPYETIVELKSGKINPQNYVSDVLLFEVVNGKAEFRHRVLKSRPEDKFFFEDPRISTVYDKNGKASVFLSGTDYSSHVPGSTNPDVANRYMKVDLDARGTPQAIPVNAEGRPNFSNMSPMPRQKADGNYRFVDAKNATITQNEKGNIVVRPRLRPDFGDAEVKALFDGKSWKYGEQAFVFEDMKSFEAYDWNNALEDLAGKGPADRVGSKPLQAKMLITDKDLKELYKDPRVDPSKGKGLGPGTPPVRVVRRGDKLFVSDGKNAPEHFAGLADASLGLKDGEATYIAFDHEIRYFQDKRGDDSFTKRHYTMSIKQFNPELDKIEAYYGDVIQPRNPAELGVNSGIADLQHVYPMGREVLVDDQGLATVRVSMGISDAHTELVRVDIARLLKEMAPGSAQRRSGQVYRP